MLRWRALPFVVVAIVAVLVAAVAFPPKGQSAIAVDLAGVVLGALALGGLAALLPSRFGLVVPLGFIVLIAIVRHRFGGGDSGLSVLMFLPVVWIAIDRSTRQAIVGVMAMVGALALPIVVYGQPQHTNSDWRRLVAVGLVAALIVTMVAIGKNQATQDPLTGIGNRRRWAQAIEQQMSRSTRRDEALTVVIVDLDRFKELNDTRGHIACDAFLASCAASWERALRPEDILVRAGGDEFFILLPGTRGGDATEVLRRLAAATPEGQTFSAGIATWNGTEGVNGLMRRADAALYAAKHAGRGQVGVASARDDVATPRLVKIFSPQADATVRAPRRQARDEPHGT